MKKYLIGKTTENGDFLPLCNGGFGVGGSLSVTFPRAAAFQRVLRSFRVNFPDSAAFLDECTVVREVLHPSTVLTLEIDGEKVIASARMLCAISCGYAARAREDSDFPYLSSHERDVAAYICEVLDAKGYFD